MHAALALLLTLPLFRQDAPAAGESLAQGDHFQIVCHFDDDAGAAKALKAAEAVWPSIVQIWGAAPAPLEKKLVLHLYADAASYEAAEEKLTAGRFKKNLSFSSYATGESHIAVQPELPPDARDEIGIPVMTLRLVAHEAWHIAIYRLVPTFESHPDWLAEGFATWAEGNAMKSLGWSGAAEDEPFTSTATVRCQRLLAEKKLPSASTIVSKASSELEFLDAYAVHQLFFRFLMEKRADLTKKMIARIKAAAGGDGFVTRVAIELEKIYGKKFTQLDTDFRAFLGELQPSWDEVYRSLETGGDTWVQAAFDKNAIASRTQPFGKLPLELRGFAKVLAGTPQMNVLLDRGASGFLSVALRAENGGTLTVLEYDAATDQWKQLGIAENAGIELGREVAFHVSINNSKKLLFEVGEGATSSQVLIDVSHRDCTGAWGLGVQANGVGIWRRVRAGR